jgi:hypothetical protein
VLPLAPPFEVAPVLPVLPVKLLAPEALVDSPCEEEPEAALEVLESSESPESADCDELFDDEEDTAALDDEDPSFSESDIDDCDNAMHTTIATTTTAAITPIATFFFFVKTTKKLLNKILGISLF